MVNPCCTGLGVGMALLAASARVLYAAGHRELRVWVHQANPRAIAFYWRCGFRLLPGLGASARLRSREWRRQAAPDEAAPAAEAAEDEHLEREDRADLERLSAAGARSAADEGDDVAATPDRGGDGADGRPAGDAPGAGRAASDPPEGEGDGGR